MDIPKTLIRARPGAIMKSVLSMLTALGVVTAGSSAFAVGVPAFDFGSMTPKKTGNITLYVRYVAGGGPGTVVLAPVLVPVAAPVLGTGGTPPDKMAQNALKSLNAQAANDGGTLPYYYQLAKGSTTKIVGIPIPNSANANPGFKGAYVDEVDRVTGGGPWPKITGLNARVINDPTVVVQYVGVDGAGTGNVGDQLTITLSPTPDGTGATTFPPISLAGLTTGDALNAIVTTINSANAGYSAQVVAPDPGGVEPAMVQINGLNTMYGIAADMENTVDGGASAFAVATEDQAIVSTPAVPPWAIAVLGVILGLAGIAFRQPMKSPTV